MSVQDTANQIYNSNMQTIGALAPLLSYTDSKESRKWNEKMYEKGKQDNIDFMNMQRDWQKEDQSTQRNWALEDYNRQRQDSLADAERDRAWALQDYDKMRQHALEDYNRQRQDYLADLASERAYNSPEAQMQRMLAAGLNPALMYGSGQVANTSSSAQSMTGVNPTSMASPGGSRGASMAAPSMGAVPSGSAPSALPWHSTLGATVAQMYAPTLQASLIDIQRENLRQDIDLKKANIVKTLNSAGLDLSRREHQDIANHFASSMFETDISKRQAETLQVLDSMQTASLSRMQMAFDLNHLKPAEYEKIVASTKSLYASIASEVQQMSFLSELHPYNVAQSRENVRHSRNQNTYFEGVMSTRQRSEILDLKLKSIQKQILEYKKEVYDILAPSNRGWGRSSLESWLQELQVVYPKLMMSMYSY